MASILLLMREKYRKCSSIRSCHHIIPSPRLPPFLHHFHETEPIAHTISSCFRAPTTQRWSSNTSYSRNRSLPPSADQPKGWKNTRDRCSTASSRWSKTLFLGCVYSDGRDGDIDDVRLLWEIREAVVRLIADGVDTAHGMII